MNYIVMDLEWNQSPSGKRNEVRSMPFEIIEIGAVKLDSEFNVIDEFNHLIKPEVYKELHFKTKEILGISMEKLQGGGSFYSIGEEFLQWCGEDYVFCTWGSTDLIEFQRNMEYFGINSPFKRPFFFYDIQKLFSILYDDGTNRCTLKHAIEQLGLGECEEFHRAVNDARYTAGVMQNIDMEKVKSYYSIDCFKIPGNKRDEIYAVFGNYEKYISRGFHTREAAAGSKETRAVKCFICGEPCRKYLKWFSTNTKVYYGLFGCAEHGLIKGRIKIKSSDSGQYYAVRFLKITDEAGAQSVRQRQNQEREKRRIKRRGERQEDE